MNQLIELARQLDIEENEKNLKATGVERNVYAEICRSLEILKDFKFEPYQPINSPPKPEFIKRLQAWLQQFDKKDQKSMLYLSSKIIFLTQAQITYLMEYLFQNKLKKMILEDIIKKKNFEHFSYKKAENYFAEELEKTLFVGLSDSSRINDFTHVNSLYIKRQVNTGIELETLLYPVKKSCEIGINSEEDKELIRVFEKDVLLKDEKIKDKVRLIILEDFTGSGSDIIETLNYLYSSQLPFKEIVFASYIITYKAINRLERWIKRNNSDGRRYFYAYGILIPEEAKCCGNNNSYLKLDWHNESIDICENVSQTCEDVYNKRFFEEDRLKYVYGYENVKIAFVYYYNCPDNSLPIIWCDKGGWKPLFPRVSRIL